MVSFVPCRFAVNSTEDQGPDPISALLRGARTFREREYGGGATLMRRLSSGQQPRVLMIACADSRVDPALIFDARPGDLLMVRQAANLVPPPGDERIGSAVMSAVELGLKALRIPNLIVCGHSHCAGVRTALERAAGNIQPEDSRLHDWTAVAEPACREVIAEHGGASSDELACHAEQRSILKSLENLRAHTWLRDLEAAGEVTLHGWWFDIATGHLWIADPETGEFAPASYRQT